jgi:hypothetical protein
MLMNQGGCLCSLTTSPACQPVQEPGLWLRLRLQPNESKIEVLVPNLMRFHAHHWSGVDACWHRVECYQGYGRLQGMNAVDAIPHSYLSTVCLMILSTGTNVCCCRCPRHLRKLIKRCWDADPYRRPPALEVARELALIQRQLSATGSTSAAAAAMHTTHD